MLLPPVFKNERENALRETEYWKWAETLWEVRRFLKSEP
jgi:hypothetical protein